MCVRKRKRGRKRGERLRFSLDRAKNTALYVFVFIKHDEWSHYINTMEAGGSEKVELSSQDRKRWIEGGMEQIPIDGTLSAL